MVSYPLSIRTMVENN